MVLFHWMVRVIRVALLIILGVLTLIIRMSLQILHLLPLYHVVTRVWGYWFFSPTNWPHWWWSLLPSSPHPSPLIPPGQNLGPLLMEIPSREVSSQAPPTLLENLSTLQVAGALFGFVISPGYIGLFLGIVWAWSLWPFCSHAYHPTLWGFTEEGL